MKARKWMMVAAVLAVAIGVQAEDIVVSWESNGVLVATGMEPGTTGTVEWASSLGDGFTNNPSPFEGLVVDSNGTLQVAIPMFFRVAGTPQIPEGMVAIPAGINKGTDPDFGAYSLTNEAAFYMDQYEVKKEQWDTVYNWAVSHGYSFDNAGSGKASNHPVQTVNWYDCVKWCNARSQMDGRTPCYTVSGSVYKTGQSTPDCDFNANSYRLPTSDEWEYAARGGLSGKRFPWGDTITHSEANYYSSSSYSYDVSSTRGYHPSYDDGDFPYTSPAGSFASNGYGLYDMSGNVWEWCTDWHPNYVGSYRVIRGGGWGFNAYGARCCHVYWNLPDREGSYVGLRAVLPAN